MNRTVMSAPRRIFVPRVDILRIIGFPVTVWTLNRARSTTIVVASVRFGSLTQKAAPSAMLVLLIERRTDMGLE